MYCALQDCAILLIINIIIIIIIIFIFIFITIIICYTLSHYVAFPLTLVLQLPDIHLCPSAGTGHVGA